MMSLRAIEVVLRDTSVGAVTMREPRVDWRKQVRWVRLKVGLMERHPPPLDADMWLDRFIVCCEATLRTEVGDE